jgi:hypothetical protein
MEKTKACYKSNESEEALPSVPKRVLARIGVTIEDMDYLQTQ